MTEGGTEGGLIDFDATRRKLSFVGQDGNPVEVQVPGQIEVLDPVLTGMSIDDLEKWKEECDAEVLRGRQDRRVHIAAYWLRKRIARELERERT